MAKLTLNAIGSRYGSIDALNDNSDLIEAAFENTLSRDGIGPNNMEADLDMDSNSIINVANLSAGSLIIGGLPVSPGNINYTGQIKETQVATSGQTVFNLTSISYNPLTNNLSVYVDGVYQNPSRYTETNSTRVTFSTGLHVGAVVDFAVLSLNDLGGTADAANVTYTPAGSGAVGTNVATKLKETVSVKDFGAVGDGVTDDTAAFTAAISAAPSTGQRIYVPAGTYLISSKLTLNKEILLFGDGCSQNTGDDAATKIIKAAGMTTALIDVTSASISIEHIGFEGVTGNTGDGIHVKGSRCALRNVSAHKMGQDGIRIGGDADENCNLFVLDRVFTRNNGRHGVYIHDTLATGGPDTNGGLINLLESASNGGDGLKMENAWYNTVTGCVPQGNTGYGINIVCGPGPSYIGSRYHTIVGGDQNEGNAAGEVYNSGYACVFLGTDYTDFTDVGKFTSFVGAQNTQIYSATFNSTDGGTDDGAVLAKGSLGSTIYPVRVRNTSNAANGRGVGLEFQPPDATNSYRTGGRIRVQQATTNQDRMILSVNESGSQVDFLDLNPNGDYVAPGTDNTISSGSPSARWSKIFTAQNSVSGLGSAASNSGARAMVSDSTVAASGNFGAVVASGGANVVPVYSDGSNWRIG